MYIAILVTVGYHTAVITRSHQILSIPPHDKTRLQLVKLPFLNFQLQPNSDSIILTLILLTWTIWRAPNNASKWRMGFNSAFKGLISGQSVNAKDFVVISHEAAMKLLPSWMSPPVVIIYISLLIHINANLVKHFNTANGTGKNAKI